MAAAKMRHTDSAVEILKDLLIVQLGIAGVKQQAIRQILGCDIVRVNRIVKHIKLKKNKGDE